MVEIFRDYIKGFPYVIYILILLFFIFTIVGYLVTDKYRNSHNSNEKNRKSDINNAPNQVNNSSLLNK